jgi:alpha-ribazole phosphatase
MLLDLIRHGETETPGRLLGRTDPLLSDAGWRQLEQQTDARSWDRIVASPRRRARPFAEALAQRCQLPLSVDGDWAELDFGAWDGRIIAELSADTATAERLAAFYGSADAAAPEGESWGALRQRVERAIDALLAECAQQRVLVVTHAGPIRTAVSATCGMDFSSLWALRVAPGTRVTLRVGRDPAAGLWGEIVEVVQPCA